MQKTPGFDTKQEPYLTVPDKLNEVVSFHKQLNEKATEQFWSEFEQDFVRLEICFEINGERQKAEKCIPATNLFDSTIIDYEFSNELSMFPVKIESILIQYREDFITITEALINQQKHHVQESVAAVFQKENTIKLIFGFGKSHLYINWLTSNYRMVRTHMLLKEYQYAAKALQFRANATKTFLKIQ